MASLLLRNFIFALLQPGVVAVLIPFLLLGDEFQGGFSGPFQLHQYTGILAFCAGLFILVHCIVWFAVQGRGTLFPADPTKKMVVRGLYRYSRNPMYVGVMLVLVGESIFFQSGRLWGYSLLIFAAFNLFIILAEEPRLRREFGEDYRGYCKRVRRWL